MFGSATSWWGSEREKYNDSCHMLLSKVTFHIIGDCGLVTVGDNYGWICSAQKRAVGQK
jgi:hypothetical protein